MSCNNLRVNDPVSIERNKTPSNSPSTLQGIVAFLGPVSFDNGDDWVGVRLTGNSIGHGRNNGSIRGVRYFDNCGYKCGIFVRDETIKPRALGPQVKREKMGSDDSDGDQLGIHALLTSGARSGRSKRLHLNQMEKKLLTQVSLLMSDSSKKIVSKLTPVPLNNNSEVQRMEKTIDRLLQQIGLIDNENTSLQTKAEEYQMERTVLEHQLDKVSIISENVQIEVEGLRLKLKEAGERTENAELIDNACGGDPRDIENDGLANLNQMEEKVITQVPLPMSISSEKTVDSSTPAPLNNNSEVKRMDQLIQHLTMEVGDDGAIDIDNACGGHTCDKENDRSVPMNNNKVQRIDQLIQHLTMAVGDDGANDIDNACSGDTCDKDNDSLANVNQMDEKIIIQVPLPLSISSKKTVGNSTLVPLNNNSEIQRMNQFIQHIGLIDAVPTNAEELEMERTVSKEQLDKVRVISENTQKEVEGLTFKSKEAEERTEAAELTMEVGVDINGIYNACSGDTCEKENDGLALAGEPTKPPSASVGTINSAADTSTTTSLQKLNTRKLQTASEESEIELQGDDISNLPTGTPSRPRRNKGFSVIKQESLFKLLSRTDSSEDSINDACKEPSNDISDEASEKRPSNRQLSSPPSSTLSKEGTIPQTTLTTERLSQATVRTITQTTSSTTRQQNTILRVQDPENEDRNDVETCKPNEETSIARTSPSPSASVTSNEEVHDASVVKKSETAQYDHGYGNVDVNAATFIRVLTYQSPSPSPSPSQSSSPPTKTIEHATTVSESPLMASVFSENDMEVGNGSLNFGKEIGCYILCEHGLYSDRNLKDGTASLSPPTSESPLMGTVFLKSDNEVGNGSLHFCEEIGCYTSCEHDLYSDRNLKDGTASLPPPTKTIEHALMGSVFLKNDREVGNGSLHFDKEIGCYISCEHDLYSDRNLKDGTEWPPRVYFTEQSFNSNERKFCGLINFRGRRMFELVFDKQFLCVLSGKIVRRKKRRKDQIKIFGKDCIYTNSNLAGNVDLRTVKRLEEEGATKKTLRPFYLQTQREREQEREREVVGTISGSAMLDCGETVELISEVRMW